VVFSEEAPASPHKLFTVTGDVLASVVPIIKEAFSHGNATLSFGEQGKISLGSIDSIGRKVFEVTARKVVSNDIYQTVRLDEGEIELTSGTILYYCVYAKLSADGGVEEAE